MKVVVFLVEDEDDIQNIKKEMKITYNSTILQ